MANGFRIGSTFHFNDRIDDDYLYVVASDLSAPEVVILSITTHRRFSDTSCLLLPGDHPFINRTSVIAYLFAELITVSELESKLQNGDLTFRSRESLFPSFSLSFFRFFFLQRSRIRIHESRLRNVQWQVENIGVKSFAVPLSQPKTASILDLSRMALPRLFSLSVRAQRQDARARNMCN